MRTHQTKPVLYLDLLEAKTDFCRLNLPVATPVKCQGHLAPDTINFLPGILLIVRFSICTSGGCGLNYPLVESFV